MNRTEEFAERSFFADLLLPLKRYNMRRDVQYLDLTSKRETYWAPVVSRTNGLAQLSGASDGAALLELLGSYWAGQSDSNLQKLLPYLSTLQQHIMGSAPIEGDRETPPTEFVYPLF